MSVPRFRVVQGKAIGERSTPPTGTISKPEQAPLQHQIKQELDYVPDPPEQIPMTMSIKRELPTSPPQQMMGGAPQPPHQMQNMQQRPIQQQQMHYQPPHQQHQPQSQPQQQQPTHQQQQQPQQPQMTPQNIQAQAEDRNVQKCVRFLKTLISLSMNEDPEMPDKAVRVRNLIQGVIYMETTAEEFTRDLQQVLKSQAQPHLLPFLQNTLPALRNAVRNGSASVEGVNPPPGYVFNNGRVPQQPPQQQMVPQHPQQQQQNHEMRQQPHPQAPGSQQIINRLSINNNNNSEMTPQGPARQPIIQQRPPMVQGGPGAPQALQNQSQGIPVTRTMSGQGPQGPQGSQLQAPQLQAPQAHPAPMAQMTPQASHPNIQNSQNQPPPQPMEIDPSTEPQKTRQYPEGSLKSSILKPDEVLNRITKRMMTSCSVEEEALIAISDAVESHLRELITTMAGVAEHRVESMRVPDNYIAVDDVKRQLRFLEDLDRQEEEMRESREKESLIRMSKNKNSGKETIEKAKEMQRQDAEAKRNRDANAAAIAALSTNRTVKNKWEGAAATSSAPRPRTVRVTTRDLHLLVNQDNRFSGSFIREKLSYGGPAIDPTI